MVNRTTNYYLDLEAICDFVNGEDSQKASSTEINEVYTVGEDGKLKLQSKNVSESKITSENNKSVRYNLFSELLEAINMHEDDDDDDYGTRVKLNTLLTYGFLKPANTKK